MLLVTFYLNAFASLAAAMALSYVVLSSKIDEGLVVKVGLGMMVIGLASTGVLILFHPGEDPSLWQGLWNAGLLTRVGLVVVVVGYWLRIKVAGHPCNRRSDWARRGARR